MSDRPMVFQIKAKDGRFYFNLKAANGEIILTSELYRTKVHAEDVIASVKKNSTELDRYDRRVNRAKKDYFVLKAANHEIIGVSDAYASKAAAEDGICLVMAGAATAEVNAPVRREAR